MSISVIISVVCNLLTIVVQSGVNFRSSCFYLLASLLLSACLSPFVCLPLCFCLPASVLLFVCLCTVVCLYPLSGSLGVWASRPQ